MLIILRDCVLAEKLQRLPIYLKCQITANFTKTDNFVENGIGKKEPIEIQSFIF